MIFKRGSRRQDMKLAADQELRFAIRNRRNKLLGLWAAGLMNRTGRSADQYALEIVRVGLAATDDATIVNRIAADVIAAGRAISPAAVIDEMNRLASVAALEHGQSGSGVGSAALSA